jgi:hypothetical protein
MSEIFRTRDCVVFFKGDAYTVNISPQMQQQGWLGGQAVMWDDSPKDEFRVTYSDGLYGGFFLWGSDESSDQYVSFFRNQLGYGFGVLCLGGWLISTTTYEKYTYASRTGGGPLVPIVYTEGVRLRFSLRGYFTTEDEWTLSGDPRAPNGYYIGSITQSPKVGNGFYLGIQTAI